MSEQDELEDNANPSKQDMQLLLLHRLQFISNIIQDRHKLLLELKKYDEHGPDPH